MNSAIRTLQYVGQGSLARGDEDGHLQVEGMGQWDYGSYVTDLACADNWLAVALLDGRVELLYSGEPRFGLRNLRGCLSVALSPHWLAAGFEDGQVWLTELPSLTPQPGFRLRGHVTGLEFLADGTLAACSPLHDGVQLWRQDGDERSGHLDLGPRRRLAARPEGGLAASREREVALWPEGTRLQAPRAIRSLAAAPGWVAAGCMDGQIALWGAEERLLRPHDAEVLALAFGPSVLASGALDGTLALTPL